MFDISPQAHVEGDPCDWELDCATVKSCVKPKEGKGSDKGVRINVTPAPLFTAQSPSQAKQASKKDSPSSFLQISSSDGTGAALIMNSSQEADKFITVAPSPLMHSLPL